jgi:hypothetical protein
MTMQARRVQMIVACNLIAGLTRSKPSVNFSALGMLTCAAFSGQATHPSFNDRTRSWRRAPPSAHAISAAFMVRTPHLCGVAHGGEAACPAATCDVPCRLPHDVILERLRGDATCSAAAKAMQVAAMPIASSGRLHTVMGTSAVEPRKLRHYRQRARLFARANATPDSSPIPPFTGLKHT